MTDTRQHDETPSEVPPGASEADTVNPASEAGDPVYKTGGLRLAALILSIVAVGLIFDWATVWVILGIVIMIFLHELGHFVTAKWAGMKVTDFFIGFGPRIWSFQRPDPRVESVRSCP